MKGRSRVQQPETYQADTMSLKAISADSIDDMEGVWNSILERSSCAWYRHTLHLKSFHTAVAADKNVADASFFITQDGAPIGVQPLLFMDGFDGTRQALYNGGPLPWPCFVDEVQGMAADCQNFAFESLFNICQEQNIDRCDLALNAPDLPEENHIDLFDDAIKQFKLIDSSFPSHLVNVHEGSFMDMRASYRKNIRKHSKLFFAQSYQGTDVSEEIEQAYFELHVKDAGGQFRPRESYTKMADLARNHEACFVVAREIETRKIVGVLILATYKNAAYDSSVAIDPDFHQSYISHILKAEALSFLNQKNIAHYELGAVAQRPSIKEIPSLKNHSISFFKDGFSRGTIKNVFVAEKHFTRKSIEQRAKAIEQNLIDYFEG